MKKLIIILSLVWIGVSYSKEKNFFEMEYFPIQPLIKQQMIDHIVNIKDIFEVNYAPLLWKKHSFNWDLEVEITKSMMKIYKADNINIKEYHQILRDLFASIRDYHVGIYFFFYRKFLFTIYCKRC